MGGRLGELRCGGGKAPRHSRGVGEDQDGDPCKTQEVWAQSHEGGARKHGQEGGALRYVETEVSANCRSLQCQLFGSCQIFAGLRVPSTADGRLAGRKPGDAYSMAGDLASERLKELRSTSVGDLVFD